LTLAGISHFVAILLCWTELTVLSNANHCPVAQALLPCTCDHEAINCMNARSTQELITAFRAPGNKEHKSLWIQKTSIESFPAGVLGGFKFNNLHVEMNSNLTMFDLNSLRNTKEFLVVLSLFGNALSSFDFRRVINFPKLLTLNLGKNRLRTIPARAFGHPTLERLVLTENPIDSVGPHAFALLPRLNVLQMSGTRLTTLGGFSMSILSRHPELVINLENSGISSISNLAFDGTTPLALQLSRNNLTSLPESVFRPLLSAMFRRARQHGQLPTLLLGRNPLSCLGCSYRWLVPLRTSPQLNSVLSDFACSDGTPFDRLTYNRIRCNPYGPF
ncbi:unnamed protein product, partial [Ixodes hexagonus]